MAVKVRRIANPITAFTITGVIVIMLIYIVINHSMTDTWTGIHHGLHIMLSNNEDTHGNINHTYTVSNPLCKHLFPSSIWFHPHHKTGTVLARNIHAILRSYCGILSHDKHKQRYDAWIYFLNFRDSPQSHTTWKGDNIRMHFWRDPVLTIVSGFTYHLTCKEHWASRHFTLDLFHIAATFFEYETDPFILFEAYLNATWTFNMDKEPPIWRNTLDKDHQITLKQFTKRQLEGPGAIRDLYLYYMNDVVNQISLKHYGDYYGFNIDFEDVAIHRRYNIFRGDEKRRAFNFNRYKTYKRWYKKKFVSDETFKYGLYFEMIRYLFVVFPEIYLWHVKMAKQPQEYELKMETWHSDFDHNMNVILDALNLIDSAENREILKQNSLSYIDIREERQKLANELKSQDSSRIDVPTDNGVERYVNDTKQKNKRRRERRKLREIQEEHIHTARNNTKYIHELLTLDMQICLLLKYVTNLIEYGWQYSTYC
eukprot:174261_1